MHFLIEIREFFKGKLSFKRNELKKKILSLLILLLLLEIFPIFSEELSINAKSKSVTDLKN